MVCVWHVGVVTYVVIAVFRGSVCVCLGCVCLRSLISTKSSCKTYNIKMEDELAVTLYYS